MRPKVDFHTADLAKADLTVLARAGIRHLLLDIDNTLAEPGQPAGPRVGIIAEHARAAGLSLGVVTNSASAQRAADFARALGTDVFIHLAGKPFPFKLNRLIRRMGYQRSECALAGDQLQTDRRCARWAKIYFVLVEPLSPSDALITRLNRLIEAPKRRRWARKGLLGTRI